MTGFEVYRYYLGLKTHFTTKDYDVIASNGKVRCSSTSYDKRRDRSMFESLAAKYIEPREVIKYLIANFAYGHNNVLYDREVGQEMLSNWIKVKESLSRVFHDDLQIIMRQQSQIDGNVIILKLFKANRINIETVSLICQYMPDIIGEWDALPESKLVYGDDLLRIRKVASFVKATKMCDNVWIEFKEEYRSLR